MRFARWQREFQPLPNKLAENSQGFDGLMFERQGAEWNFVAAQAPERVWTVLDTTGTGFINNGRRVYLAPGLHYVNRIGFFVCVKPWSQDQSTIQIAWRF